MSVYMCVCMCVCVCVCVYVCVCVCARARALLSHYHVVVSLPLLGGRRVPKVQLIIYHVVLQLFVLSVLVPQAHKRVVIDE